MSCFLCVFFLGLVFAALTVSLLKATTHDRCLLIDIYALDPDKVFIGPLTQDIQDFEIFAVFELPPSYKLRPFTVKFMDGYGAGDYADKMRLLMPTYRVGSMHKCMLRTFPSTRIMLERPGDTFMPGYDNLVLATAAATAGFMACAGLLMIMMYRNINVEDRMKETARNVRNRVLDLLF